MLHGSRHVWLRLIGLSIAAMTFGACSPVDNPALFWDGAVVHSMGGQGGGNDDHSNDVPDADVVNGEGGTGGTGGSAEMNPGGSGGSTMMPSGGTDGGAPRPNNKDGSVAAPDSGVIIPPAPATACTFTFAVTTATMNGDYSPDNIGAVWIQDSAGKFVKTLNLWAKTRIQYVLKWNQATKAAGVSRNTVDAVTGATASSHVTHTGKWNCKDFSQNIVPYGNYQVCMEMTETEGQSKTGCLPFVRGADAYQTAPANDTNFKSRSIKYAPQ